MISTIFNKCSRFTTPWIRKTYWFFQSCKFYRISKRKYKLLILLSKHAWKFLQIILMTFFNFTKIIKVKLFKTWKNIKCKIFYIKDIYKFSITCFSGTIYVICFNLKIPFKMKNRAFQVNQRYEKNFRIQNYMLRKGL